MNKFVKITLVGAMSLVAVCAYAGEAGESDPTADQHVERILEQHRTTFESGKVPKAFDGLSGKIAIDHKVDELALNAREANPEGLKAILRDGDAKTKLLAQTLLAILADLPANSERANHIKEGLATLSNLNRSSQVSSDPVMIEGQSSVKIRDGVHKMVELTMSKDAKTAAGASGKLAEINKAMAGDPDLTFEKASLPTVRKMAEAKGLTIEKLLEMIKDCFG